MSPRNKKYTGVALHRMALLHAIGQLEIFNNGCVKVSDVLQFMGVSKPTAIKHLKRLVENNEVVMKKISRGNYGQWSFVLHEDMAKEFNDGVYRPYFTAYCKRVLKVL